MTQIAEFRMTMTFTCTTIGQYSTTRPKQWKPYQFPTAKLEPTIGVISPVVELHGQQEALWESRPVDISQ